MATDRADATNPGTQKKCRVQRGEWSGEELVPQGLARAKQVQLPRGGQLGRDALFSNASFPPREKRMRRAKHHRSLRHRDDPGAYGARSAHRKVRSCISCATMFLLRITRENKISLLNNKLQYEPLNDQSAVYKEWDLQHVFHQDAYAQYLDISQLEAEKMQR